MRLELVQELLLAVKELVLEFDANTGPEGDRAFHYRAFDGDGSAYYENEVEDLRALIEKIEGRSWGELVEQARSTPYHLARENIRLDAQFAMRKADEAEEAAKATEWKKTKRREREFLKALLAGGERPREEIYAAIAEAFPDYRPGRMSGFASEWPGIAKRKEAGVWYWRLKERPFRRRAPTP